jgi:hypothetical protein
MRFFPKKQKNLLDTFLLFFSQPNPHDFSSPVKFFARCGFQIVDLKSKSPFARPLLGTKTTFLDNYASHLRDTVSGPGSFGDLRQRHPSLHGHEDIQPDRGHRPIEFCDNGLRRRIHQLFPTRRCSWYKLYLHFFGPGVLRTIIMLF